jgi:hypothetical protein
VHQGPRGSCLMKKTRVRKSRVRVPLNEDASIWTHTDFSGGDGKVSNEKDVCMR